MVEARLTRTERARETRRNVIAAATKSFLQTGYGASTIRQIAERASVSPETIYKSFGTKAALLKAAYDVALAGDDEAVAMADRPELMAVRAATTPSEAAIAYARAIPALARRTAPLMQLALGSVSSDPELADFVAQIDAERLTGATRAVQAWAAAGWLRTDPDQARDVVWMLNSPSFWSLMQARGWSDEAATEWLHRVLTSTVFIDKS